MKRLLLGAFIALAALTSAVPAQAGRTFGLFVGCGRCCNSCDFRIRQYNAFTPVCSGSVTCDGCMPFSSGMPGLGYGGYGCPAPSFGPACCDAGYPVESFPGAPQQVITAPMAPQAPVNTPVLMPPGQISAYPNYPGYNVQPVNYYPNYGYAPAMPAYPPMMNYWNPMGQVPYYWNSMGGR